MGGEPLRTARGGRGGRHTDFSDVAFNFTRVENVEVGEANANLISWSATIADMGDIKFDTYLLQTEGDVGPNLTDPESSAWHDDAEFIDVEVEIKGPKTKPK